MNCLRSGDQYTYADRNLLHHITEQLKFIPQSSSAGPMPTLYPCLVTLIILKYLRS